MKKEVQEYLELFLSVLNKEIPVEKGNHALIFENNQLMLWVNLGGKFQSVIFDYEDISANDLAYFVIKDLKEAKLI